MVLTRAHAKAEADAQAARCDEDDRVEDMYDRQSGDAQNELGEPEDITDGPSRDTASALVVAETSGASIAPGVEDHLERLAGFFLAQARSLAEGHAMLQSQHEGQRNAHSAAIMAVQASTETGIKHLTDQQLAIAGRFEGELVATQSAIREQLMAMQAMQAQSGEQIEKAVTKKIFDALREVQCESQALITSQAYGVSRLETQLDAKIKVGFQTLTSRIQQLVEEQTAVRLHATTASEQTVELVHELVEKAATDINAHMERSLARSVQVVRDELKHEVCTSAVSLTGEHALDAVKHLVAAETSKSERRIEALVQNAVTSSQSDMHLQAQRQADATAILREQFQQYKSGGEGLRSDDARELVRKEVAERMATLQSQFQAVELERRTKGCQLQALERERLAELHQSLNVTDARQAGFQATNAELKPGMTQAVAECLQDPSAADISAEIKRSVERSVEAVVEIIRDAVDRYAHAKVKIKSKLDKHGSSSEDDGSGSDDELSEEDRDAQQRMRDAFIRAQDACTPAVPSRTVQVGGPLLQDGDRLRTKHTHHASPTGVQHPAMHPQCVRGSRSDAGRRGGGRSGGGRKGGGRNGGPHRTMDRQAIISGLQQEVSERAEAAAQRYRSKS
jgi:hypothetical protein